MLAGWPDAYGHTGEAANEGKPVELTGADPAEIKGWMTTQQVLDAYPVDQSALYERFGIPDAVPPSTPLKELEGVAESFSVSELRAWVAEQGAP
jgi:hypothetical protein